ncbi:DUF1080 domain-containing protein [Massilia sp. G4R7]|uniref:DUF1080 domain-containing protein n=1 Tax=Massilia phyllostachyos TaxID=2898585 RepID=A0ABS8QBB6_9BURK|nr:DUF1080 domain-containing protein [Massilia phyllostachyos]MCD2519025.1 DUF1080 domain-containing protein [Massilia phyllostachyos]
MLAKAMIAVAGLSMASLAQAQANPKDTEVWSPEPARVTPAPAQGAPSDAVVLFGGKDLGAWVSSGAPDKPAPWLVADGAFTVRGGSGDIQTRHSFSDYQLHLEWRVPATLSGSGQARGNSGVFLASTGNGSGYEIQILDCVDNKTYVNGQAASIYKQHVPLVNACARGGEWQTYDVIWTAPRFAPDGALLSPGFVTALHNGVLVQNHVALQGESLHVGKPSYRKHGALPIRLQDHGDAVSFRNVWIRPL